MSSTVWIILIASIFVAYFAFTFWSWITRRFLKIFTGGRIINFMIILEIIGIIVLVTALIVMNTGNPTDATLSALMITGLILALPAALFLLTYLLLLILQRDESIVVYSDHVNYEWMQSQHEEMSEREQQALSRAAQLDAEIEAAARTLKKEESEERKEEIETTIEIYKAEKEELVQEAVVLGAEQKRLQSDKEMFKDIEAILERCKVEGDIDKIAETEEQYKELQKEQVKRQLDLDMAIDTTPVEGVDDKIDEELFQMRNLVLGLEKSVEEEQPTPIATQPTEQTTAIIDGEEEVITGTESTETEPVDELAETLRALEKIESPVSVEKDENISLEARELAKLRKKIAVLENEKERKRIQARDQRAARLAEKRALLSRDNIDKLVSAYFLETAACFLMNRDGYKDKYGISPYNRIVVNKDESKVTHLMATTANKFYRFSELLVDAEVFAKHDTLYPRFAELKDEGTSLVRIAEKLHVLYLQSYRKDFIKDFRYREDWDNLLILASHHYNSKKLTFAGVFSLLPFNLFDSSGVLKDSEIVNHLSNPRLLEYFREYFPNWENLGFESEIQAYVTGFFKSNKKMFKPEQLPGVILKDIPRISKALTSVLKKSNIVEQAAIVTEAKKPKHIIKRVAKSEDEQPPSGTAS